MEANENELEKKSRLLVSPSFLVMSHMAYPQIDHTYIQNTITSPLWSLGSVWLAKSGLASVSDPSDNPESPQKRDGVWKYIQSLYNVFPDPICLDFKCSGFEDMTPILQLIPHMSSLTALKLALYSTFEDSDERASTKTMLSKWTGVLNPSQLNQLQHLCLRFNDCGVDNDEISEWLKQMPHLQSFVLLMGKLPPSESPLCIPPLTELHQVYIRPYLPNTRLKLYLPVLPALRHLTLPHPEDTSGWLPNLSGMTALESLACRHTQSGSADMSHFLPPTLEKIHFSLVPQKDPDSGEFDCSLPDCFWTDMMKLTRLNDLNIIGIKEIPESWLAWLPNSNMRSISAEMIRLMTPEHAPILEQVLPTMNGLRSLRFGERTWMLSILRKCTQLTQLSLAIPEKAELLTPAIKSLKNLVELTIRGPHHVIPSEFYTCYFPSLTTHAADRFRQRCCSLL